VSRRGDWPYLVERPGRGQVRACPTCGSVAIFSCHHTGVSVGTVVMNAARAAHLRRTSGEYRPHLFNCDGCGYEGPFERGATIGELVLCARCSGATDRQVDDARRQVSA
jgi:hypothetical protein